MRSYSFSFLLLGLAVLLSGCFDEITKHYDGPAQVEFAQYQQPFSPSQDYTAQVVFPYTAEDEVWDFALALQLIAEHQSSDTHINFTANGENTTAEEGVHYNVLTTDNRAVFPANESYSEIALEALSESLVPGEDPVSVELLLQDSEDLRAARNYNTYHVDISRALPSIADVLAEYDELAEFVSILEDTDEDVELLSTLDSDGSYTVVAPNNAAVANIDLSGLEDDEVSELLHYHVVDGTYTADDLATMDGETLPTLQGEEVTVTVNGTTIMINDIEIVQADLEAKLADVAISNGAIHVLDEVLDVPEGEEDDDE